MNARIVSNPDRGGFNVIHKGSVFWARTRPLARIMVEAIEEQEGQQ